MANWHLVGKKGHNGYWAHMRPLGQADFSIRSGGCLWLKPDDGTLSYPGGADRSTGKLANRPNFPAKIKTITKTVVVHLLNHRSQ